MKKWAGEWGRWNRSFKVAGNAGLTISGWQLYGNVHVNQEGIL